MTALQPLSIAWLKATSASRRLKSARVAEFARIPPDGELSHRAAEAAARRLARLYAIAKHG
jgi:hypothetical protein